MTDDFEHRLRDMMRAQSGHAPDDYSVVQHVLHDVANRPSVQPPSRWRTWLVPLVAAGAVAVVAAAIVGVQNFHPSAHDKVSVGGTGSPTPTYSDHSNPAPTTTPPPTSVESPPKAIDLNNFRAVDLTWVGDDGWALGSATCLLGGGSCIAMARTTDGGKHWRGVPTPPANLADPVDGCTGPCVAHVRFATDQIGYAFGASGFFMTTDGGANWKPAGGVTPGAQTLALETLDGNVIRVESKCLPGCPMTVHTAPIGSGQWAQRDLPGDQPAPAVAASLIRVAGIAYLAIYGHTAGGAGNATSRLYVSTDDGQTWANRGEPCPQSGDTAAGNEVDATAIASGGGSLALLCTPRGATRSFILLSGNQGGSFRRARTSTPDEVFGGPLAVSGQIVLAGAPGGLYRSTDSGDSWDKVDVSGLGGVSWLGFESDRDARMIGDSGKAVYTTRDAGAHWSATTFG